jgi:hypothetical protein
VGTREYPDNWLIDVEIRERLEQPSHEAKRGSYSCAIDRPENVRMTQSISRSGRVVEETLQGDWSPETVRARIAKYGPHDDYFECPVLQEAIERGGGAALADPSLTYDRVFGSD